MKLSPEQKELFIKLAEKYNWQNLENIEKVVNTNHLNPSIEFVMIDKAMMKLASQERFGAIWRPNNWVRPMNIWFEKTERFNVDRSELFKPIDFDEPSSKVDDENSGERVPIYPLEDWEKWLKPFWRLYFDEPSSKSKLGSSYEYRDEWKNHITFLKRGLSKSQTTTETCENIHLGFFIGVPWNNLKLRLIKKLLILKDKFQDETEMKQFVLFLLHKNVLFPSRLAAEIFLSDYVIHDSINEDQDVHKNDPIKNEWNEYLLSKGELEPTIKPDESSAEIPSSAVAGCGLVEDIENKVDMIEEITNMINMNTGKKI